MKRINAIEAETDDDFEPTEDKTSFVPYKGFETFNASAIQKYEAIRSSPGYWQGAARGYRGWRTTFKPVDMADYDGAEFDADDVA